MHKIYTRRGMVISSRPTGEADKIISVLTDEMGLLKILVKSGRREDSKHRYGLDVYTVADYSFVRGERVWRLTGVSRIGKWYEVLSGGGGARLRAFARVARLLERLTTDEGENRNLLHLMITFAENLKNSKTEEKYIEICAVYNLLHILGYIGENPEFKDLKIGEIDEIAVQYFVKHHKSAINIVNSALHHSHL